MDFIDNQKFYEEILKYQEQLKKDPLARANDYLGSCILKMCNNYTYHKRFLRYTQQWKEEMIILAIEDCVKALKLFNCEKYKNPFAYFTQTIRFAFFRVIEHEKEQVYNKYKTMQRMNIDHIDEEFDRISNDIIKEFEDLKKKKKIEQQRKSKINKTKESIQ